MSFDYSGGTLAFIDQKEVQLELDNLESGPQSIVARTVKEIYRGMSMVYDPADKNDATTQAIQWIFDRSNPRNEQVLFSLVMDNDCGDMSFSDFCDMYGYDVDSIKEKGIWTACVKQSKEFRKVVGDLLPYLQEELQDY